MAIESRDPGTGTVIETFAGHDGNAVETIIQTAAQRAMEWRRTPLEERCQRLVAAAEILENRAGEYGELIAREMGKLLPEAIAEVEKCARVCRYYAEHAEAFLADEKIATDKGNSYVSYQPLGVILAVMPWNFPFWQVFRFAAPALAAGNVGLLKHASNVPRSALALEAVFKEAGFPQGCFQTLLIDAQTTGKVIEDPRIAAVTLTGSEGAGASVAATAGRVLKKSVLELGGSDPFIVLPSADFDKAVATGVKARMINNGQSCIAAKRFLVHADIYDRFLDAFEAKINALSVGYQLSPQTEIGPLATAAIRDELETQVQDSVRAGARLLGGQHPIPDEGYYYAPRILTDVPENAPAFSQELFGPVAIVFRIASLDEAITLANATPFGLGASAWTTEPSEQKQLIQHIQSGCLFINQMVVSDPALPFGGIKRSGFGRELSRHGMHEFLNAKTIAIA